jgi:non-ribosomal peptide synthetase component E (peptide arylation enzyme)
VAEGSKAPRNLSLLCEKMLGLLRSSSGLARHAQRAVSVGARAASTVGGALDEAVERLPHKEAFRSIKQDVRWSYKELDGFVQEFAYGLQSLKFQPGDVLAVWLPNNAENVRCSPWGGS